MSQLQPLKASVGLHGVAALLGFRASSLAFILYRKAEADKYHSFEILKRRGGSRHIDAPSEELKLLQRRLADVLQDCMEEINRAGNMKDDISHGFKRDRSIITNATKHRKRRYVFNIDLQDFFGTINFGRVRGFFIKDRNFQLNPAVATILAQIACYRNSLPQGSPCSPVISNLIGHVLDIHLTKLASTEGCTYSRYADDITFSTSKPDFPRKIARRLKGAGQQWEAGAELQEIVTNSGFKINLDKTRMQYRTSRQDVTGLVVNSKVNIRSEYRRGVRAMAHRLFTTGSFQRIQMVADAKGSLAAVEKEGTLPQLHGMLGHIYFVDLHNWDGIAEEDIRSKESLYRRFLMYKEFYAASAPVILCEGKTDIVYIKNAIRSLAASFPTLATISAEKKITLQVRIFNYPETSTGRILQLEGGTGQFVKLIPAYVNEMRRFKAAGKAQPFILVIDNDQGAQPVYNVVKQITGAKPNGSESFIHIDGNLYLVPTPIQVGKMDSVIEEAFTEQTRSHVIDGKTFSPTKNADSSKHYGKYIFSKYVEKNANNIDFSGFTGILKRLAEVIDGHRKKNVPLK